MFLSHEMPTRLRALSLEKRTNTIARTPIQCLKNRACTDPHLFAIPGEVQNNDIQSHETNSSVNENQKNEKENVKEKEVHKNSADTPLMEEIEEHSQQTDAEQSRSSGCNGEKQGINDVKESNSKINKERSHICENSTNTGQVIDKIESRVAADNLTQKERLLLDLPEDLLSYLLLTFLGDVLLQDLCRISLTCHTLHRLVKPFLKTLKIRIVCTILYIC